MKAQIQDAQLQSLTSCSVHRSSAVGLGIPLKLSLALESSRPFPSSNFSAANHLQQVIVRSVPTFY